jgi:hypothetical protein
MARELLLSYTSLGLSTPLRYCFQEGYFMTRLFAFAPHPVVLTLLLLVAVSASAMVATPAMAQGFLSNRGNTRIEGPGFKVERRNGWFGTQQNVYSDVLGNRVEQKTGWFGRKRTDTQVLGNRFSQDNWGTSLKDNKGNVIVERRRGWFGRRTTTVNTNPLFNRLKNTFSGYPVNSPNNGGTAP